MAKLSKHERALIEAQLININSQIEKIRQINAKVPDILINTRNQLESKLNPNKHNAKKSEWNGMNFDSTFEMEYAQLLHRCGIQFEHHRIFELMKPFELKYGGILSEFDQKIRAITYEPDFVIEDYIIIDVKGNEATQTRTFEDKWKLLKSIHGTRYYYMLIENASSAGLSISKIRLILGNRNR